MNKTERVVRIFGRAKDVWGSSEAAIRFLTTPHMLLDMRRPVDVAGESEAGLQRVEAVIGRLQAGVAS